MQRSKMDNGLKVLVLFWSATGNTEKVAGAIQKALLSKEIKPVISQIDQAGDEELYNYDLVFFGSPSYQFLPPQPVQKYIKRRMKMYGDRGDIKPCAPKIAGKTAVIFCTYSGPHTGINEATTAGDYIGQFFEHIGFDVPAKWYIIGEFHGNEELSTKGKLGDIRGRPNRQDLAEVEKNVSDLIEALRSSK
jgi:flavodoxin